MLKGEAHQFQAHLRQKCFLRFLHKDCCAAIKYILNRNNTFIHQECILLPRINALFELSIFQRILKASQFPQC